MHSPRLMLIGSLFGICALGTGCSSGASAPPDIGEGIPGFTAEGAGGGAWASGGAATAGAPGGASNGGSPGPGTGGVSTSGGAPGSGGSTPTPSTAVIIGTVSKCESSGGATIPATSFPECTSLTGCTAARCVPKTMVKSLVPPQTEALLASCDEANYCVPDDYVVTAGQFLPKKCTSLEGAEGRCISTCVPQVNGLMDALPIDVCHESERCAPCINPNDGTNTHACDQACDTGPSPETTSNPKLFQECQNGIGVCVPQEIIPEALKPRVPPDTCTQTGYVCAPLAKTQNLKYNFPACVPTGWGGIVDILGEDGANGQHGGCVPAYLAGIDAIHLLQDTCLAGELCAPCKNPLAAQAPTGACPVPLPSDPSGGLPPDPRGGSGSGGASGAGGAMGTGGLAATAGGVAAGGLGPR